MSLVVMVSGADVDPSLIFLLSNQVTKYPPLTRIREGETELHLHAVYALKHKRFAVVTEIIALALVLLCEYEIVHNP